MSLTGYFAHLDFVSQLKSELHSIEAQYDRLFICSGPLQESIWAQNIWLNPRWIPFDSIKDAAKKLTEIQRNWSPYGVDHFRRLELISNNLPYISNKRLNYLAPHPKHPLGAFSLIEPNLLIASPATSSPWPHGAMEFEEDKTSPPSRAYLKLWDLFTRYPVYPKPGEVCLDLGASPGGWTWVLTKLGAKVIAIDRAELSPSLMKDPNIHFKQGDAFKVSPEMFPETRWIFSDLICYPDKLYEFISIWLADSTPRNFVCTVKLQGDQHYDWLERFKNIPNSKLIHLYHNKHEITWILLQERNLISDSEALKI
jgi:23S rRNA (cytidine2498-2'-O)-methyltransferase